MTAVSLSEARIRIHESLLQAHVPAEYARIIEDHFLGNEVLGKSSHGIVRLPAVLKNIHRDGPGGAMKAAETNGQSMVFDANGLPGVVAVTLATESLIRRLNTGEHSIAAAGVTNYQQITGVLGRYAFEIAEAGFIGIAMANSWSIVAPPGGREPMIGTNPIALALPTEGDPLVVDVSTAATPYGKVLVARAEGELIEPGALIDADGKPSREPSDAEDGAMLALGDHKGFGLGLIIELLCGSLIGADSGPTRRYGRKDGAFLLAIRPNSFGSNTFAEQVTALCKTVTDSAPRIGSEGVRTPGVNYKRLQSKADWPETIEVPDGVWKDFLDM